MKWNFTGSSYFDFNKNICISFSNIHRQHKKPILIEIYTISQYFENKYHTNFPLHLLDKVFFIYLFNWVSTFSNVIVFVYLCKMKIVPSIKWIISLIIFFELQYVVDIYLFNVVYDVFAVSTRVSTLLHHSDNIVDFWLSKI